MNPIEMLCFIGTRAMGALEFEPVILKENKRTFSIEIDSLVATAQQMLDKRKHLAPISTKTKNRPSWRF